MPRFAANLAYLFTERPFLERFAAAAAAGFEAVELQFPYDHAPALVRAEIERCRLTMLGIMFGVGAVISMLLLIHRAAHPHVGFLGRIPGARRYSDLDRHPDNEPVNGVVIFRPEGSLLYFNADHVRDAIVAAGLQLLQLSEASTRTERGEPVPGLIAVAKL